MKFNPKAGKVYNLATSIDLLETAYLFGRNIFFEGRLSDGRLVTYEYDTSDSTFSMEMPLHDGYRTYRYRKTENGDNFTDLVVSFIRINDEERANVEETSNSTQQIAEAGESLWW
jgi:hypothetical protein